MNNTKISVDIEFYSKNISILEIWERVEKYLLLHLNENDTIKLGEKSYKIKNISKKIIYSSLN